MGYIYRDLKPENILLRIYLIFKLVDHSGHIMLADFDLSHETKKSVTPSIVKKLFIDTRLTTSLIRTNSFVGTEEYICPEVIKGLGHTAAVDWWTLGILLFEMIYGTTPFKVYYFNFNIQGSNRNETFKNIMYRDVYFPDYISASHSCKQLIRKLLHKNEEKRLGSRTGSNEIKTHAFFKNISWALLRNMKPPIIPVCGNDGDTVDLPFINKLKE
jgi:protein-serine/threonine kinase